MIKKTTLTFLKDLKKNNNRDWFKKHKNVYESALADFEELIGELLFAVSAFDKTIVGVQPKETMFRIYRDVRFAKDKTPYKTHFGAVIGPGGRKCTDAMYYFHLEPGNSFLAGGLHQPPSPDLAKIRTEIDKNGSALKKIMKSASFKKLFEKIEGEQLISAPRGYDVDHPHIDLLRYKDLLITRTLSDTQALSQQLVPEMTKTFKAMKPFNDFLNNALGKLKR